MGTQALQTARQLETSNQTRLAEISERLEELKAAEKHGAKERLQLAKERKQTESLKSMQLCAGCKGPINRNPYFSLSKSIYRKHCEIFTSITSTFIFYLNVLLHRYPSAPLTRNAIFHWSCDPTTA